MHRFPIVFVAAALFVTTACHRTNKAEQLSALDNIYQAGLLTKEEYDTKKLALTGAITNPVSEPVAALPPVPAPSPSPATTPPEPAPPRNEPTEPVAPPTTQPPKQPAPAAPQITSPARPTVAASKEPEPAPLNGCEDAEYKSGGQKGAEERFFAASPEVVKRAAVSALDSLDFTVHKNSNNEIEASKKRHIGVIIGAGGERVILTFQKTDRKGQSGTRVIGETKKSLVGRMAQKTWTDAVLAQIACKLRESR